MSPVPAADRSVQQLFDLTGKVVLISGATGYLGSAMSSGLAEAGARIVVTSSQSEEQAQAVADRLPGDVEHIGIQMNQMDESSIERGFAEAINRAGQLDVLVNNGHEANGSDWTTVDAEQFSRQLANSTGYFLLARHLRQHTVERGAGGSVINLGSMYGQVASYPDAYEGVCPASPVAYHALKGGIIHMTRHLAVYWAKDQVRVNCLSPGAFPNPDKAPGDMVERLIKKCPMQRMGVNHELKGAIVFLASDASSYMTGQNLTIDGGWTAW